MKKTSEVIEYQRNSPKVTVCFGMTYEKRYGPIFFGKASVTDIIYRDMLQQVLEPHLLHDSILDNVFQQDGAPCHYTLIAFQICGLDMEDLNLGLLISRFDPFGFLCMVFHKNKHSLAYKKKLVSSAGDNSCNSSKCGFTMLRIDFKFAGIWMEHILNKVLM